MQASAFREYFDITVSEGYGGRCWSWHPRGTLSLPLPAALTSPLCIPAVISVNHPLDYEQLANGVIYLTVMAKDAGNPPLNSTVPVTIEVFVSAFPSCSPCYCSIAVQLNHQ